MAIDILMPTLNSGKHLDEVLKAAESLIPVSQIIAADGDSKDGTLSILEAHGARVFPDGGSLGSARQVLIDHATTPYFLMLDSDVVLEKGDWYEEAMRDLDAGVGAVVLQMPIVKGPLQDFISFYQRLGIGGGTTWFATMATFFSKRALEGIHIPHELDGSEDLYIMFWLLGHGKTFKVIQAGGIHYHSENPAKGRWIGAGVRNLQKFIGWRKVFPLVMRNIVLYPFTVSFAAICTLNWPMEKFCMTLWWHYIQGYVSGEHAQSAKADW